MAKGFKIKGYGILFGVFLNFVAPAVCAKTLTGTALIIEADTFEIHGQRIRLEGIDAPESGQQCYNSDGTPWRCGKQASLSVSEMVVRRSVSCEINTVDRYGRGLGTCFRGQINLNGLIVHEGWALAYTRYSTRYVADQNAAKYSRRGIWNSRFVDPWDWRRGDRLN